ncbi:hypothetical protein IQ238_01930 [Pleurocapsales cyanobacterium LEGE 06147]|nr:hypothetical protein [Pleurocapsales cyanobacterium LEGE 06147]
MIDSITQQLNKIDLGFQQSQELLNIGWFMARQQYFMDTTKKEKLGNEDLQLLERVENTLAQLIESIKNIKEQNDWHNSDF